MGVGSFDTRVSAVWRGVDWARIIASLECVWGSGGSSPFGPACRGAERCSQDPVWVRREMNTGGGCRQCKDVERLGIFYQNLTNYTGKFKGKRSINITIFLYREGKKQKIAFFRPFFPSSISSSSLFPFRNFIRTNTCSVKRLPRRKAWTLQVRLSSKCLWPRPDIFNWMMFWNKSHSKGAKLIVKEKKKQANHTGVILSLLLAAVFSKRKDSLRQKVPHESRADDQTA